MLQERSYSLRHTKFGAAGSRVVGNFRLTWTARPAVDFAIGGSRSWNRHQPVVRLRPCPKSLFYDSILERVVAQHGYSTSWNNEVKSCLESGLERRQFVVDGDPERLEGPTGRVAFSSESSRYSIGYDVCQVASRFEGAGCDDGTGNPAGHGIFPVFRDDARELGDIRPIDDISGCGSVTKGPVASELASELIGTTSSIKSHVERSFVSVAKTARRVIHLRG